MGLATTGPPPTEVPHSNAQDDETDDSTNYTTGDFASRICTHSGATA
jgi:hypothetical protein